MLKNTQQVCKKATTYYWLPVFLHHVQLQGHLGVCRTVAWGCDNQLVNTAKWPRRITLLWVRALCGRSSSSSAEPPC